jgi:hypothetical protein
MQVPPSTRRNTAQRGVCFSLSAHQMGGEGRGEAGSPFTSRLRFLCFLLFTFFVPAALGSENLAVLKPDSFAPYIEHFNSMEDENVTNFVSNAASWNWLQKEIPFFECPDREVEEMYYFRWWSFRKHLVQTPQGFVITEFLTPVKHAGIYNTLSCAAGFHIAEGRWLRDQNYLDDYIRFWLRGDNGKPQPHFHRFSSWLAAAAYDRYLVRDDKQFLTALLDDFATDYRVWEKERQLTNGLFWQFDVRDGMEESISGSRTNKNLRLTINSYMFANARAIATIARQANKAKLAAEFETKAAELKRLTQNLLWNPSDNFFEVRRVAVAQTSKFAVSRVSKPAARPNAERPADLKIGDTAGLETCATFSNAREAIGFIPWMFELPDSGKGYEAAWTQLTNPQGFHAPFGITTAERRHPQFRSHGVGTCEWDGAVWPFATSQTLYALANVLRDYKQHFVTSHDYFEAFLTYVHSQHADGKPYLGEYLDEVTGDWINGKNGRSRYYNHSTFADLLITAVIGLRPRADDVVEIYPLLTPETWDWFCLDGVKYHGHMLTILWDKDGSRYGHGAGLRVLADGKQIANAAKLERATGKLP